MSVGNGSLLGLAPVPMCFAGLLVGALNGTDKDTLLSFQHSPVKALWERGNWADTISEVSGESFKHREPQEIRETGYVVKSMQTPPQQSMGRLPEPTLEPKPSQLNGGSCLRWRWRSRRWLTN